MLSVDELQRILKSRISPLSARRVPLCEARGLRLAETVIAPADEPSFDRSAMDGFAIQETAAPGLFEIKGESLPGNPTPALIGPRQALRVFTGSSLPSGVRVIMQEDTSIDGRNVRIECIGTTSHVRLRGSATRMGQPLLSSETTLTPAGLAVLASAGCINPLVIPRPRVAHLTTGREIVDPAIEPRLGQIRNTNAPLIQALLQESEADQTGSHHSGEDPAEALHICREKGLDQADVLLISGGSSGGAHDHTERILRELGFEIICHKVNCRPGKPLIIGLREGRVAVGLPGNPLSHFVAFHVFVRQILALLAGRPFSAWKRTPLRARAVLAAHPRETFWPARLKDCGVDALPWLDSGHLSALVGVNALIRVPSANLPLAGESVEVVCCSEH